MSTNSNQNGHHPFEGNIILFKGLSQYDVLRYFADDLYEGFKELGCNAVVVDLTAPGAAEELKALLAQPIFFVLGFNGVGIDLKAGNRSLYDACGFPFFAFLVDHPLYHLERLKSNVQNLIVSCVDQKHVEFLKQYENLVCSKAFIPHGARQYAEPRPFSERKYRLVFAGTYVDPDNVRKEWLGFDRHLAQLLDDAAERAVHDPNRTLPEVLQALLNEKGLGENPVYLRKLTGLLHLLDRYVRAKRRVMVLEALAEFPLHVFGNGWDRLRLSGSHHLVIHPSVSYNDMQQIMCDTQMMLSVLPNFQYGGHERIFSSMLAGAVSLTDTNAYLEQHFRPGQDFVPFSLSQLNTLRERVGTLLEDTAAMEEIAGSGRAAVLRGHLWKHRAERIVEAAKFHYTFYPLHM